MKLRAISLAVACLLASVALAAPKSLTVKSPSGNIGLTLTVDDSLHYSVDYDGKPVVTNATIGLNLADKQLGVKPSIKKTSRKSVSEDMKPVVPFKHSTIKNNYNELTVNFKGDYGVQFRVFDNGVAHRFVTTSKDKDVRVSDEKYNVTLKPGITAHLQQPNGFKTSCEELYTHKNINEWTPADKMSELPVLMESNDGTFILISESDIKDYPGMFLKGDGKGGFTATYPKVPTEFGYDGDRSVKIVEESDYIAHTTGTRTYPWRFMAIGTPATILEQTLVAQLAPKSEIADPSWIKPGFVSWEWWNGATPYGEDVDFESGFNLETYKYFIDFAAKYGIPYILMDEGWAKTTTDPYTPNPNVDLNEIIRYGKEKGVGVFLWLTWLTVENNFDLFKKFNEWGISGVKIDFMDRQDQWMTDFYERVCKEAANNHLLVDFHGAFKPSGLEYKYPNLMSYEGVRGMEYMGGCIPDNSVYYPFIRNAVGPMDYTPGAMISMQPYNYHASRPNAASIGTRAYQMALFVLFESGIQMLADNPTMYYRNDDCTKFITNVPVTWDETRMLKADVGNYVAVAKRNGNKWYVGAMANSKEKWRDIELSFDFLEPGKEYKITWVEDGINAPHQAMDYRIKNGTVNASTKKPVKLARSGGWAAIIEPK